jgi:hypothetical protein
MTRSPQTSWYLQPDDPWCRRDTRSMECSTITARLQAECIIRWTCSARMRWGQWRLGCPSRKKLRRRCGTRKVFGDDPIRVFIYYFIVVLLLHRHEDRYDLPIFKESQTIFATVSVFHSPPELSHAICKTMTTCKGKQPLLTPFYSLVTSSSPSVFMSQLNLMQLNLYPLPYTTSQPPQELVHDIQTVSGHSDTAAFDMGLDNRDVFLGLCRCVICGHGPIDLQRCHIVDPLDTSMVRRMPLCS